MYKYNVIIFDIFFQHDINKIDKLISSLDTINELNLFKLSYEGLLEEIKNDKDNPHQYEEFKKFWNTYIFPKLPVLDMDYSIVSALE